MFRSCLEELAEGRAGRPRVAVQLRKEAGLGWADELADLLVQKHQSLRQSSPIHGSLRVSEDLDRRAAAPRIKRPSLPSSRGLGHSPLKAKTGVRIPLGALGRVPTKSSRKRDCNAIPFSLDRCRIFAVNYFGRTASTRWMTPGASPTTGSGGAAPSAACHCCGSREYALPVMVSSDWAALSRRATSFSVRRT